MFAILPISLTVWIGHLHTISPEYGSYKAQLFARPVILYCGACYLCSIGQTFRPILKGTYLGVLVIRALIVGVGKSYVDDGIAGEFSRGVFGEPIGASSDFALLALLSLLLFFGIFIQEVMRLGCIQVMIPISITVVLPLRLKG